MEDVSFIFFDDIFEDTSDKVSFLFFLFLLLLLLLIFLLFFPYCLFYRFWMLLKIIILKLFIQFPWKMQCLIHIYLTTCMLEVFEHLNEVMFKNIFLCWDHYWYRKQTHETYLILTWEYALPNSKGVEEEELLSEKQSHPPETIVEGVDL